MIMKVSKTPVLSQNTGTPVFSENNKSNKTDTIFGTGQNGNIKPIVHKV